MPPLVTLSATELLNRLRSRGVTLRINGSKLRASPRSLLTDDDRATIRERKSELLEVITVLNDAPGSLPDWLYEAIDAAFPILERVAKTDSPDWLTRWNRPRAPWCENDAALIDWFQSNRDQLPTEPFDLNSGIRVSDPHKFFRVLDADIQAGSNGPRAAGLLDDLKWLRK